MTKWDQKYRAGYGASGMPEPALIQAIANIAPGAALDLACGRGRNAVYLAAHGWMVTALGTGRSGYCRTSAMMTVESLERYARRAGWGIADQIRPSSFALEYANHGDAKAGLQLRAVLD